MVHTELLANLVIKYNIYKFYGNIFIRGENMKIKNFIIEDFVNYKKPSLFISMPKCTFKCEKDCGIKCCQNSNLVKAKTIEIRIQTLINIFDSNTINQAIVFGGLEPFDSFEDLQLFIGTFRFTHNNDIVIYTGYNEDEIISKVNKLIKYGNIIIKYGRFIPNQESHYDEILGVNLASSNQYAKRY